MNHHRRSAQVWHVFSRDFTVLTCIPTRSSAIGMSHTRLCLPSRSWYSFTDPGGMEGWVDLKSHHSLLSSSEFQVEPFCMLHGAACIGKIRNFLPMSRYISETVQDRSMDFFGYYWTLVNRKSYVPDRSLSVPMTLSETQRAQFFRRTPCVYARAFDQQRSNSAW